LRAFVLGLALLSACEPGDLDVRRSGDISDVPDVYAADVWGPYEVGFITLEWVDARGKTLVADVWYPATHGEDDVPSPYDPTILSGSAVRGAAPDRAGAPYPVVAFSHGSYGIRFQSVFLMEFLASHGYVSISPDHERNTFLDPDESAFLEVLVERPGDMQSSIDHLLSLAERSSELLSGMVEDGDVVAMGHSFGAFTSLVLGGGRWSSEAVAPWCAKHPEASLPCQYLAGVSDDLIANVPSIDPRVQVTVAMAPGIWYGFGDDGEGLADVTRPLLFGSRQDDVLPYEREVVPTFERLSGERGLVSFDRAKHYAPYSNLCEFLPAFSDACVGAPEWVDPMEAQTVTQTLTLAWIREALTPGAHDGDLEVFERGWGDGVDVTVDR